MSTISQVSKNLKKKLSFEDYTPQGKENKKEAENTNSLVDVYQQDSKMANQLTSEMVGHHNGLPAEQQDGKMVKQQNSIPVRQHTVSPTKRYTSKTASQSTIKPAYQQASNSEKIKVTYYLTAQEHQALMDIYIQRLQRNKKTDKSALIGEAIQLLYKRETKV